METIKTFFDKYFWHLIFWIGLIAIITNYFTHSLTDIEKAYHGIVSFIALAVINIRRWLEADKC